MSSHATDLAVYAKSSSFDTRKFSSKQVILALRVDSERWSWMRRWTARELTSRETLTRRRPPSYAVRSPLCTSCRPANPQPSRRPGTSLPHTEPVSPTCKIHAMIWHEAWQASCTFNLAQKLKKTDFFKKGSEMRNTNLEATANLPPKFR